MHFHTKSDELHGFWVPADTDVPMQMKTMDNNWRAVQKWVGGHIERISTGFMPELHCGCSMIMLVDEEAKMKNNVMANMRATTFYPPGIFGDVLLVGEGPVGTKKEWEPDWFSLPQSMVEWEGPGAPIPAQTGGGLDFSDRMVIVDD